VATVLSSCEKEVTGISLDTSTLTLEVGEWKTLTATVLPKNAANKSVAWTTSNGTIANVVDGIVTGNMVGTTTIIAKAGNHTATCEVTVTNGLEGTTWKGTWSGNPFTVKFADRTNCTATVIDNGNTDNYSGTYTYVSQNISITLYDDFFNYPSSFIGTVSGNKMTLKVYGETIVLTKQ